MCDRISSCPRHPEMQKEVTRRRRADRSTGIAPSRGSLEAALIACGEMPTVTGREYHCPHRPSSPCREPSGSCGPSGIRSLGWNREIPPQLMAQRPLWLEAMGMCLVNGYGVIKQQQSSVFSTLHHNFTVDFSSFEQTSCPGHPPPLSGNPYGS